MPARSLSLASALVFALFAALACATAPQPMSQQHMERVISESSNDYRGSPGAVQFTFDRVPMACISDVDHDRMRLVAPIARLAELAYGQSDLLLIANYHSSLDGRYAVSDGVVYAAFLHPLSSLTDEELLSALRQVSSLARTFGTTYSSGELTFGTPSGTVH